MTADDYLFHAAIALASVAVVGCVVLAVIGQLAQM